MCLSVISFLLPDGHGAWNGRVCGVEISDLVDALLERQTRPHRDLDAVVALDDLPTPTAVFSQCGFVLKEIWGENRLNWQMQLHDEYWFAKQSGISLDCR